MTCVWILLADDDAAALASAREVLVAAGYSVYEALDGRRALQRCMASPPRVVITEILMPECDGIELIAGVKRAHPDIPVIAVTEHRYLGDLDLLHLASKLGADAVLDKPLNAERLLAVVARLAGTDRRRAPT